MTNYSEMLKSKNLKVTPQRVVILEKIEQKGHSSIDEVYEDVKSLYPSISLATVYKNISNLVQSDRLKEIKVQYLKQKYEVKIKPHIHFDWNQCEKLGDIDMDISAIVKSAKEAGGFLIEDCSVAFSGVCKSCI